VDVVGSLKIDIATCSLNDVCVSTVRIACTLFSDRAKHGSTSFQVFYRAVLWRGAKLESQSGRHIGLVVRQALLLLLLHIG
jgi:hypothetical protein